MSRKLEKSQFLEILVQRKEQGQLERMVTNERQVQTDGPRMGIGYARGQMKTGTCRQPAGWEPGWKVYLVPRAADVID